MFSPCRCVEPSRNVVRPDLRHPEGMSLVNTPNPTRDDAALMRGVGPQTSALHNTQTNTHARAYTHSANTHAHTPVRPFARLSSTRLAVIPLGDL